MTYASDNWSRLVDECDSQIGKAYLDVYGNEHIFLGLLHGQDDFYYVMCREGKVALLTCVGVPENQGFRLKPIQENEAREA